MTEYRWITDAPIEDVVTPQRWDQLRQSFRNAIGDQVAAPPAAAGAPAAPNAGDAAKWNMRIGAARSLVDQMNFAPDCRNLAYIFMGTAVGLMQVEVYVERIPNRARHQPAAEVLKMYAERPAYIREFTTTASGTGAGDSLMEWAVNLAASSAWGEPAISLMAHAGAVPRYQSFGFAATGGSLHDGLRMILYPKKVPNIWVQLGDEWYLAASANQRHLVARGDPGFPA